MQLNRNIKLPPHMQQAYLQSLNRQSAAGYVNPQLRTKDMLGQMVRSEGERLQKLDDAGYYLNRGRKWLDQEKDFSQKALGIKRSQLQMQRDDFESAKSGDLFSNIAGIGKLGLGLMDRYKTKQMTQQTKGLQRDRLLMQINYLKENNPEQYQWYMSQPYIQQVLKMYNLSADAEGLRSF